MNKQIEIVKLEQVIKESDFPIKKVATSFDLAHQAMDLIGKEAQEVLLLFCLDTKLSVTHYSAVTRGTINQSIADPKVIFQRALLSNSTSILLCHNHPSGDVDPSMNDVTTTSRIKEAGEFLGIELLDHLIVSNNEYVSLREEGYFENRG